MNILFVENHARFAAITVRTFLQNHTVTVVSSLTAARQALSTTSFNAILIDFDLDDGKGTELVAAIHRDSARPVIIAVSSHEAGNDALLQAGADRICSKMHFSEIEAVLTETCASIYPIENADSN